MLILCTYAWGIHISCSCYGGMDAGDGDRDGDNDAVGDADDKSDDAGDDDEVCSINIT